ncbi:MAG: hypothetical protein HBSAPP02_04090 [Phycisphaerae bacterium]|nr:MAG: hypothetical protein HBSAPP02_04090 [Phycisphaerae bacterium]
MASTILADVQFDTCGTCVPMVTVRAKAPVPRVFPPSTQPDLGSFFGNGRASRPSRDEAADLGIYL